MFIVGLDIGYSNLKIAYGESERLFPEKEIILPAGAAPIDRIGTTVRGEVPPGVIQVRVNVETWGAGISQDMLPAASLRKLHEDYPASLTYQALFLAALQKIGRQKIDCLVTGLPTSQYYDEDHREALRERLSGSHQITEGEQVEIGQVLIIPQPVGGYLHYLGGLENPDLVEVGTVVIADPGFFSFDWAVFQRGNLLQEHSGTSMESVSILFEEVQKEISRDLGGSKPPSLNAIEGAVREGRYWVFLRGQKLDLIPYLERVAPRVAATAFEVMKTSLRRAGHEADSIHLVGGGAHLYLDAAKEIFPGAQVTKEEEPVTANVKGFWQYGRTL